MSVRFTSYQWQVLNVIPVFKEEMVEREVHHLIDVAFLKDTTVIDRLNEFAKQNKVSFTLTAVNDWGRGKYVFPFSE